ncbi:hypothetical protein D3C76_1413090 [compost metagenome]
MRSVHPIGITGVQHQCVDIRQHDFVVEHLFAECLAAANQLGDAFGFFAGEFLHPFRTVIACGPVGDNRVHVGIESLDLRFEQALDDHTAVFVDDALDDLRCCAGGYFSDFCRGLDFSREHDVLRSVETVCAPGIPRSMTRS